MIYDILPVNNYQGNNSNTTFDFDFFIENEEQLKVSLFDKDGVKHNLILNTDYSINETKNINGSFIQFPIEGSSYSVLKDDEKISIELVLPISQEVQYNNSSLLNLETLEYSLDYLTRLIQILSRKITLCVKTEECDKQKPEELIENIYLLANNVSEKADQINNIKQTIEQKTIEVKKAKDYIQENYNDFKKLDNIEILKSNLKDVNVEIKKLAINKLEKSHSNDKNIYLKKNYQNNKSWYRIWSNGFIEQGAEGEFNATGAGFQNVFLIPFSNANCTVIFSPKANVSNYGVPYIKNQTATAFYVQHGFSSGKINWYACGY